MHSRNHSPSSFSRGSLPMSEACNQGDESVYLIPDGRLERTRRTRMALVDAYIEIAHETKRIPRTLEVAKRAGCSLRTVFERFGSLGGLGLAAFDSIVEGHTSAPADDFVNADRDTRIDFQVSLRAQTCETWC